MKIIFTFILFILLLSNCSMESSEEIPVGKVKSIIIDHHIGKDDWCGYPQIRFKVELINHSSDTLFIGGQSEIDLCDRDIKTEHHLVLDTQFEFSDYWKFLDTFKTELVAIGISNDFFILPNDSFDLTYRLSSFIHGSSLEKTHDLYKEILNSDFRIKSRIIKGKEYFLFTRDLLGVDLIYFLNDTLVNPNDSIKMNRSRNDALPRRLFDDK